MQKGDPRGGPASTGSLAGDVGLALAVSPGRLSLPMLAKVLDSAQIVASDLAPWNGAKLGRALAGVPLGRVRTHERSREVVALELPIDAMPDVLMRAHATGRLARFDVAAERALPSPEFREYGYSSAYGQAGFARHEYALRDLRIALVSGKAADVARALMGLSKYDVSEAAFQLVSGMPTSPPRAWLAELPRPLVVEAARVAAAVAHRELGPRDASWFEFLDERHSGERAQIAILHACAGDFDTARASIGAVSELGSEACLVHLLGHAIDVAVQFGRDETSATKKRRDAFMKSEHAASYLAACLALGRAADLEHARSLVEVVYSERSAAPLGVAALVSAFQFHESHRVASESWWRSAIETASKRWTSVFYLGLAAAWTEIPTEAGALLTESIRDHASRANARGYARLADELTAIERRIGTLTTVDDARLANRVRVREVWESALDRLEAGVEALTPTPTKDRPRVAADRTLGWTVQAHADEVRVHPWTRASRARSTAVKMESVAKLLTSEAAFVTEHDRRVLTKARKVSSTRAGRADFAIGAAGLFELVGHTNVVDTRDVALAVVLAEPRIRVRANDSEYVVEFSPPHALDGIGFALPKDGRLEVCVIDDAHRTLAAATSRGGIRVPKHAKERLRDVLASVGARVRVEGFEEAHDLVWHADDVDARIHVQLFRVGREGLRASFRVRPLGVDGPSIAAGTGASTVLGARDGRALRGERDLVGEREAVARIRDQSPVLAAIPADGSDFGTEELESVLELLLALGALPDIVLEWPASDALAIPLTAAKRGVVVRAKAERDWFRVDAELVLDDSTVVTMQTLLEARLVSTGRFIALDRGRYLALTDGVRKQLDALTKTLDVTGEKTRMHPLVLHAIAGAVSFDVRADAAAEAKLERLRAGATGVVKTPRGLVAELRDYQHEGFSFLANLGAMDAGAILADDMGLGKTVQALALLVHRRRNGPALVVAPTSVAMGWLDQGSRFAPDLRFVEFGTADREVVLASLGPSDVLVITYGLLTSSAELLAKHRFHTMVFDEAQALKNASTQRTQAARAMNADFRVALSGTPIENHLVELYSLLDVVIPGILGSERDFERRFAAPIRGGDRATLALLRTLVRPFILRRTKAQVLEELPPRTELVRKVVPSDEERAFYEALRRQAVATIDALEDRGAEGRMRVLAEIQRLRRAATDPRLVDPSAPSGAKLVELRELLQEIRAIGHRVLVFGQYLDALASVRADLDAAGVPYLYLDGSTPAKVRAERVAAFQDGEGDVFLISLKAGGTGLNLTGADYVVLMDPWWNPAVEDQAADRVHRIGQTRPVTIVRLVTSGTIEESIVALHGEKRSLAADVLDGMDVAKKLDLSALKDLLRG